MSLKEIEEQLYRRDSEPGEKKLIKPTRMIFEEIEEGPFAPKIEKSKEEDPNVVWIKEKEEKQREKRKKIKKIALISAGSLFLLGGLIWGVVYYRKSSFSEDKVSVSITGPEKVESGEPISYEITYKNENRAALRNAIVLVNYSDNFKPVGNLDFAPEGLNTGKFNVGAIDKHSEGKVTLKGKFFGPKDLMAYLKIKIEYNSTDFSSKFTAENQMGVFISSSPLSIEVSGPQNAAPGNAISFAIKYQNNGQEDFGDLKIRAEWPNDFSYASSDPVPASGNNVWYVGTVGAGQKGEMKLSGTIQGAMNEVKRIKFSIGEFGDNEEFITYAERESSLKIIGSPVTITQTINGKKGPVSVNAGESLSFSIKYKNTGQVGLRDLILTEEISSSILDYSSVDFKRTKAGLDSSAGIITWRASDVPELKVLESGQEGEISFSINVKDIIPISSSKDKNFAFTATAKADSPDIPTSEGANKVIASNAVGVKLNSKLVIKEEGYFNDSEIKNIGPLPLKVGEETTFTMHVQIANVSNDAANAKVTMALAPGVKWKNNFLPESSSISVNDRTGELTWNIGTMAAGMGIITDPKELVFQIGVTPSPNQVGAYIPLISKTFFSADDNFTQQKLEASLGEKNSRLSEDISVGEGGKPVE